MKSWRAVVEDAPPSANVLMRMHWAARKRLIGRWYLELYGAFQFDLPTRAKQKRNVRVVVTTIHERDYANLWLGVDKLIFDNLKKLGWLVDDSPKWMMPEVVGRVGKPQTEIEISQ